MNLRITGYGACMIAGFPLGLRHGFLQQAVGQLERSGQIKVALEIVALGGFPAPRAPKHLAKRVLADHPDVVVMQFGSIDASTPLRNGIGLRHFVKKDTHQRDEVPNSPPKRFDIIKWDLRSLASEVLLVPPLTPLETYLSAKLDMVEQCLDAGSKVVVVSPFVMGGWRSNRFARAYTRELKERLANRPGVFFLDAHTLLSPEPRRKMLLCDSFHLSAEAHHRVGVALAELLKKVICQ